MREYINMKSLFINNIIGLINIVVIIVLAHFGFFNKQATAFG